MCIRDSFDTQRAGALLAAFVDDLSNWYVRRSRRRFWEGRPDALATLHDTVDVVTRLMAPLVPFLTERVWQDLIVATDPTAAASVHLASWPVADAAAIDPHLDEAMRLTRRIVELGRSARSEAKVKTRQPLKRALIPSTAFSLLDADLCAEVMAELNVESVESVSYTHLDVYKRQGLVHQAPAFGEDDMAVCRQYGLPMVNPIRPDGTFDADLDLVGGVFFKTADAILVDDLTTRGLMFRALDYAHSYPHCWRCHTTLLYYAQPSWYIRTTPVSYTHLDVCKRQAGDAKNDIELLRWAGLGIAMGNAVPEAKLAADWTTTSNHEDGLALAIELLLARAGTGS